jgi:hypothetical protein
MIQEIVFMTIRFSNLVTFSTAILLVTLLSNNAWAQEPRSYLMLCKERWW